jgi:hypothetical protein
MLKIFTMNPNASAKGTWLDRLVEVSDQLSVEQERANILNNGTHLEPGHGCADFFECMSKACPVENEAANVWLWSVSPEYFRVPILRKLLSSDGDVRVGIKNRESRKITSLSDKTETLGFNCCLIPKNLLTDYPIKMAYAGEYIPPWKAWFKMLVLSRKTIEAVRIDGFGKV